ncbi:conserved hypothetical protein [Ricinus communis]|uniref:Uncharacterized protein n=1 Tax=Ricinus communis TaxID=3988 RepID=B9SAJ1_RICCO|nr:conserved hypothetical protein [Ricinus communis]
MPQSQSFSSAAPFLCLAIFSLLSFATSKPDGFSLELIHRDSPESPFYPGKFVFAATGICYNLQKMTAFHFILVAQETIKTLLHLNKQAGAVES